MMNNIRMKNIVIIKSMNQPLPTKSLSTTTTTTIHKYISSTLPRSITSTRNGDVIKRKSIIFRSLSTASSKTHAPLFLAPPSPVHLNINLKLPPTSKKLQICVEDTRNTGIITSQIEKQLSSIVNAFSKALKKVIHQQPLVMH